MRRISIENPAVDRTYKTYIDSDYSSGVSLTVKSNTSFSANDLIITGEPTEELTELKKVNGLSGSTILTLASGLTFAHSKGNPVYKVVWDYVSIESKSSSAGNFALLSLSPIQWDSKTNETIYFDSNGTNSYHYRFRFYNSVTGLYSEYSGTVTGTPPTRDVVQYMIDNVRKIAGDMERKIASDDEIIRIFNQAQDIIYAHNPKYFFLKVDTFETGSGSIPATTSSKVYSLADLTNYGELAMIKYNYVSGATNNIYPLRQLDEVEFDRQDMDQNISARDWPEVFKLLPADDDSDNGYFKITPTILTTGVGTFYPVYYQKMADLTTVTDSTLVPLPFLLENLAIGYIFRIKGNEAKAQIYEAYIIETAVTIRGRTIITQPKGLEMLDKMDTARKHAVGQPRQVWNFRGQKAINRLYGNRRGLDVSSWDRLKEDYF